MNVSKIVSLSLVAFLLLLVIGSSLTFLFAMPVAAFRAENSLTSQKGVMGGYEVDSSAIGSTGILSVSTGWNIPTVTCTGSNELLDFWIYVEHEYNPDAGMNLDVTCVGTRAVYTMVADLAGSNLGDVNKKISPGDKMQTTASMSVSTGVGSLVIKDITKGWTYSKTGTETPDTSYSGYVELEICGTPNTVICASTNAAPLPKFSTIHFTNVKITLYAKHGSIGSFLSASGYPVYKLIEIDSANGHTVATPSTISSASTGFSIRWVQGL